MFKLVVTVADVDGQRVGQLPTMVFKISVYFFKFLTNASVDIIDKLYVCPGSK